jgi:uncharacterized protein (TIGR03085 family)
MSIAQDERHALSDLFTEVGPDAPTLCEGWQTRDLAAHLAIRERRMDAAAGIMVPALAGYTRRVQDSYAARPWAELVRLVRSGPPKYSPTAIGKVDELANAGEFLVHHEDVRRARPEWQPRPADPARDAVAWNSARTAARLTLRKSPVPVVLRTPDGRAEQVRAGTDPVVVVGEPIELLLFVFGRDATQLTFDGDDASVHTLRSLSRGV